MACLNHVHQKFYDLKKKLNLCQKELKLICNMNLMHIHIPLPMDNEDVMPCNLLGKSKVKGKAIPLQAWTGPEGSRMLRLPDF